jgi:small subunit ribosomal protein S2
MKRFIFTERNGIYIIDIQQSLALIDKAYDFVKDVVAKGGNVLFVGTKKQAQEPIQSQAKRVGMPYVTERWLGGMLTNFPTVYKRIQRLKELEALEASNDQVLTKKELLLLRREREKLHKNLDGIRNMTKLPAAIWVVDTKLEHLAVAEAKKLGIPVIAILDTNCDPDEVDFKIPGNDDAIRSVTLLTRVITDAIAAGLQARSANVAKETAAAAKAGAESVAAGEPLADWEKELLGAPAENAAPSTESAGS